MKISRFNLNLLGICLTLAALIAADCVIALNVDNINNFFGYSKFKNSDFEYASLKSDSLVQKMTEEGSVLLKNENNTLPLKVNDNFYPINVLGYTGSNNGNILKGIGSGSSPILEEKKVTLYQALEEQKIIQNPELENFYNEFDNTNYTSTDMKKRMRLIEPSIKDLESMLPSLKSYSSTALVVLGRVLGENVGEAPLTQTKINSFGLEIDDSRDYLQTSTEEDDLLNFAKDNFDNVIVLINSSNTMNLSFLRDSKIDAALEIGIPGQSGMKGVVNLLTGKANPSGRLTDTYPMDLKSEPSFPNYKSSLNDDGQSQIAYKEGIYFGYRWYETAFHDGYFGEKKYEDVVLYP